VPSSGRFAVKVTSTSPPAKEEEISSLAQETAPKKMTAAIRKRKMFFIDVWFCVNKRIN
jgi:hypothetical protein